MDDLIYGLLIAGWLAYGIYSATKKNKAARNNAPAKSQNTPQSKDLLGNLFDTFFQESNSNSYATPHPYVNSEIKMDSTEDEEAYSFDMKEENTDYLDIVPEPETESKVDTYSGTDNDQPSTLIKEIEKIETDIENESEVEFDLRQGIIAQAILERPYQ